MAGVVRREQVFLFSAVRYNFRISHKGGRDVADQDNAKF